MEKRKHEFQVKNKNISKKMEHIFYREFLLNLLKYYYEEHNKKT